MLYTCGQVHYNDDTMLTLYNSRTREKESFQPIDKNQVSLYTCGPTVYNFVHIGNLRTYVFEDILKRALKFNGHKVRHVMNITDVGHLTDDADQGEDKIEKGSAREGLTAWEIAEKYTDAFKEDIRDLNILEPSVWCKATDHIEDQINAVQTLIDKGHTYETSDGIYFDTTSIENYGALAQLDKQELQAGARVDMGEKRNPHDFALWKFSKEGEARQMEWDAFGSKGFPGWHIECSAMGIATLGDHFDIHCGGIDHIPVHHTNEIAQSEAITGKSPWVNFWLHGEFLVINGDKMAKSGENFLTLALVKEKGFDPLAYRFFLLQTHYRKQLQFSWDAIEATQQGLLHMRQLVAQIKDRAPVDPLFVQKFTEAINDDLNTPEALALVWDALKAKKIDVPTVKKIDKVLGLNLYDPEQSKPLPADIQSLVDERDSARKEKDWARSDELRDQLQNAGYHVNDTDDGQIVFKA